MSAVQSVNLASTPARIPGRARLSGIDKHPVDGAVDVTAPGPKGLAGGGLAGDAVCDLRHHGGDDQAVYAYAREDLDWWQVELGRELRNGSFGENLTTLGINVSSALVGEQWLIGGSLLLQVTVPRIPCATFQAAIGEKRWVRRFTERGAAGTYLRVQRPGTVRSGDSIVVVERPDHRISASVAFRAITLEPELLDLMVDITDLPAELHESVQKRAGAPAR
ncbi:MAG: MOSC domain-containing protein [Nakamurella sp.]